MPSPFDDLFQSIRESCSPLLWSRGVELARQNRVVGEKAGDSEVVLRVSSTERAVSATVKLWPGDEDWLCDCGASSGVCEHVAAAVIAVRRAHEQGRALPQSMIHRGIIEYLFSRRVAGLHLERVIRIGEELKPLTTQLSSLLSGRVSGPAVNASKEDMAIDIVLANERREILSPSALVSTLTALEGSEYVSLDGVKTLVGAPVPAHRVSVRDWYGGVEVKAEVDPRITERFGDSACLCDGALCPVLVSHLSPIEKEIFARGRQFAKTELGELVSKILPALERKWPIDIQARGLPSVAAEDRPRLHFQTTAMGDVLTVLPLIVYGDPPYARVDQGRLVCLGDSGRIPERSLRAEERLAMRLHSEFGFGVGKRMEFRGDAATKLAGRLQSFRGSIGGEGLGYFEEKPELVPQLTVDGEEVRVSFGQVGGGLGVETSRVFQAWREGLERVPLLDGSGWAPIPKEWLERYGHRVLELLEAKDASGAMPVCFRPEIASLCDELEIPCPPDFRRLAEQLNGFQGIAPHPLPDDLQAELRPYQKQGVNWLAFLRGQQLGALLADDMGLGKTLQAISVFSGRVLVVAPTSVLPNWQKEIARFRPSLRVCVYHGADRHLDDTADVSLTTYAILRLDSDGLSKINWDVAVLDEAQNIKNPESQVAEAAFRLPASFRIALSGTPVENRLEDLWSLFHFLNPGLLRGRSSFREKYSSIGLQRDPGRAKHLHAKIRPFVLRRLKQEVARELPPRTDLVLYCDLENDERQTYDAIQAATRTEVLASLSHTGNVLAALECLLRLRQAACHPGLLPGNETVTSVSSKVRLLVEKLEEVVSEGHKALVFSQWTSLLDLVEPPMKSSGLGFCRIDGSSKDRASVVDAFQKESGPPVLLMTLKAGGVGLNLTAADYVFLVDPWWNPAAEDQAADRAHRIGQDRPVFVHRLVARDTVEEKILALQETKRAVSQAVLSGAQETVCLTREDLLSLLDFSG